MATKRQKRKAYNTAKKVAKKNPTLVIVLILLIILIVGGAFAYLYFSGNLNKILNKGTNDNTTTSITTTTTNNPIQTEDGINENIIYDNLQIHFLELGNEYAGDSVYIKAGEKDILIDAGSRANSASTIIDYVKQYCTDGKLEYVIATHAHQDHIAGFAGEAKTATNYKGETTTRNGVLYYFDVENLIDFAYQGEVKKTDIEKGVLATDNKNAVSSSYNTSTSVYGKYLLSREYAISNGTNHKTAKELWDNNSISFTLAEGITMNILYNYFYFNPSNDENNYSVCTMLNYNNHHFIFTGDLEEEGENKLAEYYDSSTSLKTLPHCDLFKGGHHGSPTSSNDCLLSKITPSICCVCCCAGATEYTPNNDNQFPSQEFINRIAKYTSRVYVTTMFNVETLKNESLNGNIIVSFNGTNLGVKASNNLIRLKDTEWFNADIYVDSKGNNVSGKTKTDFFTSGTKVKRRIWPANGN